MASGLIGKLFNCDANGNYKVTQPPAPVVTTPKVLLNGGQSLSLTNPNGGLFGEVAGKRCVSFRTDNTIPCFNLFPNKPCFLRVYIISLFENTVGKGENAGNQHFLLFPQCFLLNSRDKSSF